MDLHRMISELQEERHRIDEAIEALERLAAGKARRRGHPPNWLSSESDRQAPTSDGPEELASPPKSKKHSE